MKLQNRRTVLTIAIAISFFAFGYFEALKGATVEIIKAEYSFSYASVSTLMIISYAGFLLASLGSGILSSYINKKWILFLSSIVLLIGAFSYGNLWTVTGLIFVGSFLIGVGLGSIELGGNLIIVDIHEKNKAKYLNLVSGVYSIGAIISPMLIGFAQRTNAPWQSAYLFFVPVFVVIIFIYALVKYPKEAAYAANIKPKRVIKQIINKRMLPIYLLVSLYVSCEIGMGTWLISYLTNIQGFSIARASFWLSVYYVGIAAGRLGGSLIVDKMGYYLSLKTAFALSILFVFTGTLVNNYLFFLLPLTGLTFSIIFPTIIATATDGMEEHMGIVLGVMLSFVGIGGMLGSGLIGVITGNFGEKIGVLSIGIVCILCLIIIIALQKQKKTLASKE